MKLSIVGYLKSVIGRIATVRDTDPVGAPA